jgi:transaldolase/glucose-6-phosphate isomerase
MSTNRLVELAEIGQSIWYDNIERRLITSGDLKRMVEEDRLGGVTSNPAIFEKAIGGSDDYSEQLSQLAAQHKSAIEIYEELAIRDIQLAADTLASVFDTTNGGDGFVSLECSPLLAHETAGTIDEARRLWKAVDRKNVMIKIPGTPEGMPAIEECIYEGININITLLFSLSAYEQTMEAYIRGLERRMAEGKPINNVASVASFFVSRIDTAVDKRLDEQISKSTNDQEKARLESLKGRIAIANAKMAYQRFKEVFYSPRFDALKQKGAKVQRPLWASTSTKNPAYPDVYYVEALIGPETIDTIPPATYKAFRDHGKVRLTLEEELDKEKRLLAQLDEFGISLDEVTDQVLAEGVKLFIQPFEKLMQTIRSRRDEIVEKLGLTYPVRQSISAPADGASIDETHAQMIRSKMVQRIWDRDVTVWKEEAEHQVIISNALGWLNIAEAMLGQVDRLKTFADAVRDDGFKHVVLLGMGGSSLCPEVLRRTFGLTAGYPALLVLDSTVPASVLNIEGQIDPAKTLFIVSSKSGTTTEPQVFFEYFYDKVQQANKSPEKNFVAITDPGTPLEKLGREKGFRHVFLNPADIGGRYSALSFFGMVPAALAGYDIKQILERAVRAMGACTTTGENPGARLGATIGTLGRKGRNKLTFVIDRPIDSLGFWIEQLIAESTGKEGLGLVPVSGEALGDANAYGDDRVFIYLRTAASDGSNAESKLESLASAGHPVIKRILTDELDLGEEFFVWQFATAVAGAILRINPFDQPNVQESKDNTRRLLQDFEKTGRLPDQELLADDGETRIYGVRPSKSNSVSSLMASHLETARPGDYVALLAFIEENARHDELLDAIRLHVRDSRRIATTVGYGPRFLHSTGQLHKGGAATAVIIQITSDDRGELTIPGRPYGFSTLKQAQALGDFESLASRCNRAIRFHMGVDTAAGLSRLLEIVREAKAVGSGAATD